MTTLRRAVDALVAQIFPRHCQFCEASTLKAALPNICDRCRPKLKPVGKAACQICHEPFPGALSHSFTCPNCHGIQFNFDYARSALRQTDESTDLIHSYKYGKQVCLSRDLAGIIAPIIPPLLKQEKDIAHWYLVPVPLHRRREGRRGFNQAIEICRFLSPLVDLPTAPLLRRQRYTQTQTRLSRAERQKNLSGAFSLTRKASILEKSGLFLIDDVFTTGSTAEACTAVLRKLPGVEKVIVLTAMRG